jgi:NAD(P)-dependent dehydrogenase (short-subunit alcohol dehydrogenase family)
LVITGASRGLGREIAKAALAAGDRVVATARNPQSVVDAFGAVEALLPVALDVTRESSVAAAIETAMQRFGRVDVLVNNAGYGVVGAVEETSAEDVTANSCAAERTPCLQGRGHDFAGRGREVDVRVVEHDRVDVAEVAP